MGMFDYINVAIRCPECGNTVEGFQSKDADCTLSKIDPTEVDYFYGICVCGEHLSFQRERAHQRARETPYTLEEVEALGFRQL